MKQPAFLALLALLVLEAACAGSQGAQRPGAGQGSMSGWIQQPRRGDEKVTEYDLNRDQKPDVWEYYVPAKDSSGRDVERTVRKELDVNWDGRIDLVYEYDEKQRVARASFDLDFDGRVDQINFSENGVLLRKERDVDYNGKTDEWVYFEKGKVARKERDTTGDGRVDYWEYWENEQVDRFGEDLDGDGTVDRWTKSSRTGES